MTAFLTLLALWAIPSPALSASLYSIKIHTPTLQETATRIAEEQDFSTTTLFAVIEAESNWDCSQIGAAGERGCLQIIPKLHPSVDPMNFEASVHYFISEYQAGRSWEWTECNCWTFVHTKRPDLPLMKEIKPNSSRKVGSVAIFDYDGIHHIAYVTEVHDDYFIVSEANYKPCTVAKRIVRYDDKSFLGFWF
jgi:hypothetical protein